MQYLFLGAAIVLEIIATTLLKASAGFTKLLPGLGCVIFYALCFYLFSRALLNIDLGVTPPGVPGALWPPPLSPRWYSARKSI